MARTIDGDDANTSRKTGGLPISGASARTSYVWFVHQTCPPIVPR